MTVDINLNDERAYAFDFYLHEIDAINKDIQRRSSEQFRCVLTSIIVLGAVIGAISQSTRELVELLIIIPWVHAVFGIYWTDHAWASLRGSLYIKFLEKKLRKMDANSYGFRHFVSFTRQQMADNGQNPAYIISVFPLIFFIFPSIAAEIAYISVMFSREFDTESIFALFLLTFGIMFTVLLTMSWIRSKKSILSTSDFIDFENHFQ